MLRALDTEREGTRSTVLPSKQKTFHFSLSLWVAKDSQSNPILPQGSRNKSTSQWNIQHVERKYLIEKRLIKGTAWQDLTGFYSVYPSKGLLPFVKLSFAEHRQISVHAHMDTPPLGRAVPLWDLTVIKAKVPSAQVKELLLPRTPHFRHYSTEYQ